MDTGTYYLDVVDQNGKPVGMAYVHNSKDTGVKVKALQVLEEASDLVTLIQKQDQWEEMGKGKVSLLENEGLGAAHSRTEALRNHSKIRGSTR